MSTDEGKKDDIHDNEHYSEHQEWLLLLKKWNLAEFAEGFRNAGWTDPIDWKEMMDADLDKLGMKKGHKTRFVRRREEYDKLRMIVIETISTQDFMFVDGASSCNHSNIIDIRSGNPGQTTFVYVKEPIPCVALQHNQSKTSTVIDSVRFAYRYMIGYKGHAQGPSFQLIACNEQTKQTNVIYTSPQLSKPNFDDNNTVYSDYVQVNACNIYPRIRLSEPIKLYFKFVNSQRNVHICPKIRFEVTTNQALY